VSAALEGVDTTAYFGDIGREDVIDVIVP
jgi:hypothetical protein